MMAAASTTNTTTPAPAAAEAFQTRVITTDPTPASPISTAQVVTSGDVSIYVSEPGSHDWFKFVRSLVNDGTWAKLHHRHQALIVPLLELRHDETGIAWAPHLPTLYPNGKAHKGLIALSGLQRPTIWQTLQDFTRTPQELGHLSSKFALEGKQLSPAIIAAAGLLAPAGPDLYHVLPTRKPKGRQPSAGHITVSASRPKSGVDRDTSAPSGASTGVITTMPGHRKLCRGIENYAGAESEPPRYRERVRVGENVRNSESSVSRTGGRPTARPSQTDDDDVQAGQVTEPRPPAASCPADVDGDSIAKLVEGLPGFAGFSPKGAASLLRQTRATPDEVDAAIANAREQRRLHKLKTFRGYVSTSLHNGVTLFDSLRADAESAARLEDRIRTAFRELGQDAQDHLGPVNAWWKALNPKQRASAFSPRALASMDSTALLEACARKAADAGYAGEI